MTPMIDIVFLLIIFFMVVTELTLDQAELVLPVADKAIVMEPQPGVRSITINVSIDDKLKERMQIGTGPFLDEDALRAALRAEVTAYGKFEPNPNDARSQDSALEVLIRCEQAAPAGYFHKIFKACQDAKIYKLTIAAQNEHLEDKYRKE